MHLAKLSCIHYIRKKFVSLCIATSAQPKPRGRVHGEPFALVQSHIHQCHKHAHCAHTHAHAHAHAHTHMLCNAHYCCVHHAIRAFMCVHTHTHTHTPNLTGWASVGADATPHKMVMSIGYNPFYGNTHKTAEPWILSDFPEPFYGSEIRLVVCSYIRPETNFTSLQVCVFVCVCAYKCVYDVYGHWPRVCVYVSSYKGINVCV